MRAGLFALTVLAYAAPGHALPDCETHYREPFPHHRHRVEPVIAASAVDFAKRDFETGRSRLDKVLEKHANSSAIRFWLYDAIGASYMMEGRFADAATTFSQAAALPGLNFRGRFEAGRKLAGAQSRSGDHAATIATLEQMRGELCAPLAGQPAYLLAATYLHANRLPEAEATLAPLLDDATGLRRNGVPGTEVRSLDFRIQCAQGKARPCVERFMKLHGNKELTALDAGWFSRLLPAIERSKHADDLLAQVRGKGWIDASNQAVPSTSSQPSWTHDSLVPMLRVTPKYPQHAARAGISGSVLLSVVVGPDGDVAGISVLESHPPGLFEDAALTATSQWKFKPKVVDGVAVESSGTQRIDFMLGRE